METSLTETLEANKSAGISETSAAPIKAIETLGMYESVFEKETTREPGHEVLKGPDTLGRFVASPIELSALLKVLKFHSGPRKPADQKEPGAGLIDESSIVLQEWEGVVLERDEHGFTARLYEGFRDFPVKVAKISLEEVAEEQRGSIIPGARFAWMIGYRLRSGTRTRFSEIYFRRLPPWSKEELENAARAAEKLREDTGWV